MTASEEEEKEERRSRSRGRRNRVRRSRPRERRSALWLSMVRAAVAIFPKSRLVSFTCHRICLVPYIYFFNFSGFLFPHLDIFLKGICLFQLLFIYLFILYFHLEVCLEGRDLLPQDQQVLDLEQLPVTRLGGGGGGKGRGSGATVPLWWRSEGRIGEGDRVV